jgi:cyclopropane fatty-acyl-phospholipid synthase-like methyltransferase
MSESRLARAYDARVPGVDIPAAQKAERQERVEFREERRTHRRTGRTRGIIVPELPWKRETQS